MIIAGLHGNNPGFSFVNLVKYIKCTFGKSDFHFRTDTASISSQNITGKSLRSKIQADMGGGGVCYCFDFGWRQSYADAFYSVTGRQCSAKSGKFGPAHAHTGCWLPQRPLKKNWQENGTMNNTEARLAWTGFTLLEMVVYLFLLRTELEILADRLLGKEKLLLDMHFKRANFLADRQFYQTDRF